MDQAGLKGSIILQSRYLYPVFFLIDNIHKNQCGGGESPRETQNGVCHTGTAKQIIC